jgi:sulfide:quinone oxidoreductase
MDCFASLAMTRKAGRTAELICIVDTLKSGALVYRGPSRNFVSPQTRLFHWAKRAFEKQYVRAYR